MDDKVLGAALTGGFLSLVAVVFHLIWDAIFKKPKKDISIDTVKQKKPIPTSTASTTASIEIPSWQGNVLQGPPPDPPAKHTREPDKMLIDLAVIMGCSIEEIVIPKEVTKEALFLNTFLDKPKDGRDKEVMQEILGVAKCDIAEASLFGAAVVESLNKGELPFGTLSNTTTSTLLANAPQPAPCKQQQQSASGKGVPPYNAPCPVPIPKKDSSFPAIITIVLLVLGGVIAANNMQTNTVSTPLQPARQQVIDTPPVPVVNNHAANIYDLGYMYETGKGQKLDYVQAAKLYSQAAAQGHAGAQRRLGIMNLMGRGMPKNPEIAFCWFTSAAENGDGYAQGSLGWMYETGTGTLKDIRAAHYWYEKAAYQDNDKAQVALAKLYENGVGTQRDKAKAFYWYEKAATLGNNDAKKKLHEM